MHTTKGATKKLLQTVCDDDNGVRVCASESLAKIGKQNPALVVKEFSSLLGDKWSANRQRRVYLFNAVGSVVRELNAGDLKNGSQLRDAKEGFLGEIVELCMPDLLRESKRKEASAIEIAIIKLLIATASVSFTSVSRPLLLQSKDVLQAPRGIVFATGAIAGTNGKLFPAFASKVCVKKHTDKRMPKKIQTCKRQKHKKYPKPHVLRVNWLLRRY